MNQCWIWYCPDTGESFKAHPFGSGMKYTDQQFNGDMHCAIMLLTTDMSFMGSGTDDLKLQPELVPLVNSVIGRWCGKRVMMVCNYTTDNRGYNGQAVTDIGSI